MATNTAYQQLEVEHFKAREEKGFAIAARRARRRGRELPLIRPGKRLIQARSFRRFQDEGFRPDAQSEAATSAASIPICWFALDIFRCRLTVVAERSPSLCPILGKRHYDAGCCCDGHAVLALDIASIVANRPSAICGPSVSP